MNEISNWWRTWAPVWEHMEERHMGTETIKHIYNQIFNPVLIIGAGQGVLVKYLADNGFIVDSIDLDEEMIKYAKKRHGINIIKADARNLPFDNNSYKTVIISSGVVDYIGDENIIEKIINEAYRVTGVNGNLFVSFYMETESLEKIYKNLGVITKENKIYQKRLFLIDEKVNNSFFKLSPLPMIMKWTGKNFFSTFYLWTKIGLTHPRELFDEKDSINYILDYAKKKGIDQQALISSIPDEVPYRDFNAVKELLNGLKLKYAVINRFNECAVASYHKSALYNINAKPKNAAKKDGIIKTIDLSKKYKGAGKNAVDRLNLTIQKGTIFGLLGPNGAGKTTTLSMLSGLIKPTGGQINFSGELSKKNIKNFLGYIPQELALYPKLSAKENLEFFGRLYNVENTNLMKHIDDLLILVGLHSRQNEPVKNYSTGMKRRLNLAIGLINDPKLILMDEPTVGIDPQSRNLIYEAVLNLKKQGTTILYTTHYMEEATKLCDHVAIIDKGKILLEGSPDVLVKKYGYKKIRFMIKSKYEKKYYESLIKVKNIYDVKLIKNDLEVFVNTQKESLKVMENIETVSKKHRIKVELINVVEPNLESIFLDITGRHLRDSLEEGI